MSAREQILKAHRTLLNGGTKLSYFEGRGIGVEAIEDARVGYDAGRTAFTYPCISKHGDLLGIHYKSETRNAKGKRRSWWEGYAEDLPSKGHGKKPEDPAKVIPFGMELLKDHEPGTPILLFCGEEDALSARQAGYAAISQPGAGLLEPAYAEEFAGLDVVVFYDAGEEREAARDAETMLEAGAGSIRVVEWSSEAPHGADVNGRLVEDPEGFEEWIAAIIAGSRWPAASHETEENSEDREGEPDRYGGAGRKGRRETEPTQGELLLSYTDEAELFHAPDGEAYATVGVDGHKETWPLKSKRFGQWLLRRFYADRGKAPSAQALADARATIAARAAFDGPERRVFVRVVAKHGDDDIVVVYLDLCNDEWEAVEITASGWRVIESAAVPVKFVRKDNAGALPRPARGGSVEVLRDLLNVRTDEDFRLLVAWLVGTFNPDGPYPVLVLQGEQGSAKSTTVRVLRSVADPAIEPLRAPPRDERDLAIAASGNRTPALDNLSGIRPWLSDALCRLATGGGFATRELFSDDREVLFSAKRPVILNGIDSLTVAGDLRDRSIVVELPPISPDRKRTERAFYRELEGARPEALGALLDATSAALRNRDHVRLPVLPRMADFAVWATAAEGALGWEPGSFMAAYAGNRSAATELALDEDPVAVAVRRLLDKEGDWSGTSTELLTALGELMDEETRRSQSWPAAPNALSNRLKRIAPALRETGVEYGDGRQAGGSRKREKTLKKREPEKDRPDRPAGRESPANLRDGPGTVSREVGRSRDDAESRTVPEEHPGNGFFRDGRDDGDDQIRAISRPGRERVRI